MQDQVLLDLLNYWEHLRAGRVAPLRSELDPREIRGALDHTFILEHTKLGEIRFRLAGNKLGDLLGMELRGMPAYALIAEQSRDFFAGVLNDMLADPKIIHLQLEHQPDGFDKIGAQMLLLPMRNDAGQINRILGCVSTRDARMKPPARFIITDQKTTRIVSSQTVTQHQQAGFAEPTPDFMPQVTPPPRVDKPVLQGLEGGSTLNRSRMRKSQPYLRLVKSD